MPTFSTCHTPTIAPTFFLLPTRQVSSTLVTWFPLVSFINCDCIYKQALYTLNKSPATHSRWFSTSARPSSCEHPKFPLFPLYASQKSSATFKKKTARHSFPKTDDMHFSIFYVSCIFGDLANWSPWTRLRKQLHSLSSTSLLRKTLRMMRGRKLKEKEWETAKIPWW